MSVVVSVEDIGSGQKQVKVQVPAEAVNAETQRVAAEYRRQARIPGFRKGKIPAGIIMQRFGEEIEQEVVDRLLPRYWKQAEAESGLEPLLPPQVDEVDLQAGEDLTFTATVDLEPEAEISDPTKIELPDPDIEPTDEEIHETLEDLRRSVSEWQDADRGAANGDLVVAQLRRVEADEDEEPSPATFEVGDANVWEELSVAATGLKAGQKAEFERAAGDEPPTKYSVEVEKVRERDLLPLDDETVARIGPFQSLEALRAEVHARLKDGKRTSRRRERETALLNELRARHPFELPKRVVEQEIERLLTDYASGLAQRGVDVENAEIDWQKLADEVRPQAEAQVHARLLVDKIVKMREIEVDAQEFEATLAGMARMQKTSSGALRRDLDRAGKLEALRAQLRREKALRQLVGIGDGDGEEPQSAAADEEE